RPTEAGAALQVDTALVARLGELATQLRPHFPAPRVGLTDLLAYPGVLQSDVADPAALHAAALALLDEVLDECIAARTREGGKLVAAILERVDGIERIAAEVRSLVPTIRTAQRARLETRLAELAQGA